MAVWNVESPSAPLFILKHSQMIEEKFHTLNFRLWWRLRHFRVLNLQRNRTKERSCGSSGKIVKLKICSKLQNYTAIGGCSALTLLAKVSLWCNHLMKQSPHTHTCTYWFARSSQTKYKFVMIINYVHSVACHESGTTRAMKVLRTFIKRQFVCTIVPVATFSVFAMILFLCWFELGFYVCHFSWIVSLKSIWPQ